MTRRWHLILGAVLGTVLLAGCSPHDEPPQLLSPATTFAIAPYVPGDCSFDLRTELRSVVATTGAETWAVDTPYSWSNRIGIVAGVAVLETSTGIVAIDPVTGKPIWQRIDHYGGQVTFLSDWIVDVDYADGTVLRIDPTTGQEMWSHQITGPLALGAATDGSSIFINNDGVALALDPATGRELWARRTIGDASFAPEWTGDGLYYSAFEGRLYRLDPSTGAVVWDWTAPAGVAVDNRTRLLGDFLVFITKRLNSGESNQEPPENGTQLIALDLATGRTPNSCSPGTALRSFMIPTTECSKPTPPPMGPSGGRFPLLEVTSERSRRQTPTPPMS